MFRSTTVLAISTAIFIGGSFLFFKGVVIPSQTLNSSTNTGELVYGELYGPVRAFLPVIIISWTSAFLLLASCWFKLRKRWKGNKS
jgi:hypothetical protein